MNTTVKTPWHLWVVGVLSLLWNAVGAFDYTMTKLNDADYLSAFTPEQIAYFQSFPLWANAGWALGVWGDRKSTRLTYSHYCAPRIPSSAGKKNNNHPVTHHNAHTIGLHN